MADPRHHEPRQAGGYDRRGARGRSRHFSPDRSPASPPTPHSGVGNSHTPWRPAVIYAIAPIPVAIEAPRFAALWAAPCGAPAGGLVTLTCIGSSLVPLGPPLPCWAPWHIAARPGHAAELGSFLQFLTRRWYKGNY